ncbi:hypothetical protein HPB52_007224 [Rhipicephalus sanguineus]|uniref:Uncharacterized protein n=1 Tax=Rhipicephalus sanguineus TaxID=34632 RepID=A0A9D4SUE8_RHISA|nr:hypothetical protein HPB52_007224 [Rhipicephalus sanguineus]
MWSLAFASLSRGSCGGQHAAIAQCAQTAAVRPDTRQRSKNTTVIEALVRPPERTLLTTAAVCSLEFTLDKLGFGRNGVKPGSLAAAWQASKHGNVPRRSFFALLQSWGVKGVPWMLKFIVGYFTFMFTLLSLEPPHEVH